VAVLIEKKQLQSPNCGSSCHPFRNVNSLENLSVQIFADGADLDGISHLNRDPLIKGLTTNPTLMRKAGISDYEQFARQVLQVVKEKPISFEVFSDDFPEMRRQALRIKSWQRNVFVKIPVTNSRGDSSIPLIKDLATEGTQLNITAILTLDQVREVADALNPGVSAVVSVFAGRIADTGRDPQPFMRASKVLLEHLPKAELLWASVREVLNIFQADECGCHIVTVPHDILSKAAKLVGTNLDALSLDTVKMFAKDAELAGFNL
jgi:transaldolase